MFGKNRHIRSERKSMISGGLSCPETGLISFFNAAEKSKKVSLKFRYLLQ